MRWDETSKSTTEVIEEFEIEFDNNINKQKRNTFCKNDESFGNSTYDSMKKQTKDKVQVNIIFHGTIKDSLDCVDRHSLTRPGKSKTEVVNLYRAYMMLDHLTEDIPEIERG